MEDSNPHLISSDDSCDSEIKIMKSQLTEYGLDDENLSKAEMVDLLQALKNSKESVQDAEPGKVEDGQNEIGNTESPKKALKRKYVNVSDRRLPWSLFPSNMSPMEKAQTLAVYVKLMSINTYHQARQSSTFASWPLPIQIIEETTRVQPLRSTRSGRSFPIYCGFDDDSNDLDFVVSKPKKRKVSGSEPNNSDHITKSLSLKRKLSKDENVRPVKEAKTSIESNVIEIISDTKVKPKTDLFTLIEH